MMQQSPDRPPQAWRRLLAMPRVPLFLYLFGIAGFLGLYFGWNMPLEDMSGHMRNTLFWGGVTWMSWIWVVITMLILHPLLRRWEPSLGLLTALAVFLGSWLAVGPIIGYAAIAGPYLLPPGYEGGPQPRDIDFVFAMIYIRRMLPLLLVALVIHFYYARVLGINIYAYRGAGSDAPEAGRAAHANDATVIKAAPASAAPLPFVELLPAEDQAEPIAVQAQEHYLRIWNRHGRHLVPYAFGDALRDLEGRPGMQIHRSYWVADDAVASLVREKGRNYIVLANGERLPISQSHIRAARERYAEQDGAAVPAVAVSGDSPAR